MPSEFELIRHYFNRPCAHTDLSVGDDAALVRPASGMQLAISTDMLIAGTHFFPDTDPCDLGWKALAASTCRTSPRWGHKHPVAHSRSGEAAE